MKKQQQQRKKWEEQISDQYIPPELFKIPIVEAAEEPAEQQTENKQTKQTGPAKKQKEFAWMSDDDELEPDNRPSTEQPAAQTTQQPKRGQRQQQEDLFVTNIPLKAKEEDLQSYLNKFGKVEEIYMPMNEGTSVHKGKAFVKMIIRDEEFARKEHRLKGQQINIKVGGVTAKEPEPARSRSRSRSR